MYERGPQPFFQNTFEVKLKMFGNKVFEDDVRGSVIFSCHQMAMLSEPLYHSLISHVIHCHQ